MRDSNIALCSLSSHHSLGVWELNIDLCIVRVQKVAEHLYFVLVRHIERLLHRCTLQRRVLVNLTLLHNEVIEVLLDDDAINSDVVAQVLFLIHHISGDNLSPILFALLYRITVLHEHVLGRLNLWRNTLCHSLPRHHGVLHHFLG